MRKIFIVIALLLLPSSAMAEYYFNPHFILTDEDMADYQSLSQSEIQNFLEEKHSALANLIVADYQGIGKKASEIIWQAAFESKINPKVLLATLQKEQSLIEDPIPAQNQLDKATGYRCFDNAICNPKALGFGKQVDGTAWQLRQYMDNPTDWNYQPGKEIEVDGFLINPVNQATANLYNYTPHFNGNKHFWQIWQDYWGKDYPDGSLLKTAKESSVWLISYGLRRPINSYAVLLSRFNPKKILTVSKADLEKYEAGPAIKFSNYSLLRLPNGKLYLIVNDELRHILSPEVFKIIGYNWDEVENISEADLAGYNFGPDISVKSVYPTGALLKDKKSNKIYYVENGTKQPVLAQEILQANFKNKVITRVDQTELDRYQTADPVKFKDGELIKANNDPTVYVISQGYRRPIKNEKTFVNFGYKWYNIITTSPEAVTLQPLGEDLK